MAVFAEFVFHDIFHTSQAAGYRGHRIRCCDVPKEFLHPECSAMHNSSIGGKCMEYVRSSSVPRTGCTLGPREQINQVTSFLDGSVMYGSSEEEVKRLRTFRHGELKMQKSPADGVSLLLPPDTSNIHDCKLSADTYRCFLAGDVRVNENAGLMAMHTVWVREHNRIAHELSTLNTHWNDDRLFEEARRIVIAQLQHITIAELLPPLLGAQIVRQFDLEPVPEDNYYSHYSVDINAGTSNAVATAVAASFFSMMPAQFYLMNMDTSAGIQKKNTPNTGPILERVGSTSAAETHFSPSALYEKRNILDQLILGMANQNADTMEPFVSNEEITKELPNKYLDRIALIVQQGRDHGIPGYLQWRKICRLQPNIQNFGHLNQVMPTDAVHRISSIYKHVQDVDLFTGGVSENPLVGGVMGPTFACLLSRQFQHLRRGDRYWYENDLPPSSFTRDQLREIKKTSLSRILCDNAGSLSQMQPSVMLMPDPFLNAFQNCKEPTSAIDFGKWKTVSIKGNLERSELLNSLKAAKKEVEEKMAAEAEIFSSNIGVADLRSPEAMHHVFLRPKRQSNFISNFSMVLELASHNYLHKLQLRDVEARPSDAEVATTMLALSSQDLQEYLEEAKFRDLKILASPRETVRLCQEELLPCDHTTPFRTITGWCNNIINADKGKSFRTFLRMLPAKYADGVKAPRGAGVSGRRLPSARLVSTSVHYDTRNAHSRYSLALMQWGQFLDHDLTLTPMHDAPGGRPLDCKSCNSESLIHPECWPIHIPEDDPFFPPVVNGSSCISFARSLAGQLTLGPREQLDQVTSYLDASNMYGSDVCESRMLRSFRGGHLNSTKHPFSGLKNLLPQDATNVECRAPSRICFESGDIRASEQPALTSMHTIWMREHNRIVDELALLNPSWNDELLYQNGRRIVSAIMQHITYHEFLPRVLGRTLWKEFNLSSSDEDVYDATCDATIYNEFATAAYRFGHTLLKPALPLMDNRFKETKTRSRLRLRQGFFNPDILYEKGVIDEIIRGIVATSVEVFDNSITSEVTNHLFEDMSLPFSGMDLVALNLQRGRDHGLPPYNDYRVFCNRSRALNFQDLKQDIPEHVVTQLQSVYEHVDDIDIFSGGISEKPMYGALVGPTFGCIIATQFRNLKKCDRFWYETKDSFLKFTPAQLSEIHQRRLSRVICDNTDSIDVIQEMAFDLPDDFRNPRMPCSSLKSLVLSHWKESAGCTVKEEQQSTILALGQSTPMSPCVACACTKEGLFCQSLKVNNCFQLAAKYSMNAVLADDVCKVQCAFAFRAYPHFESPLIPDNSLGFSQSIQRASGA